MATTDRIPRAEALARLTRPGEPYELEEIEALGRRVRVFKHASATLRDLYEQGRSDAPFLTYGDERLTFEETWQVACGFARSLGHDLAVRRGDRVAIAMRNYPEWMIAFCAITSLGAIAVALNALWKGDELAHGLADSGARVLLADSERLERLAPYLRENPLPTVAVRCEAPTGLVTRAWADLARPAPHAPETHVGPDDDAIILYTSGSAGRPKGVVSTHRAVINALLSWEVDARVAAERDPAAAPAKPPAALLAIPLFHVTGLHSVFLSSFRQQRRVISMYKWDPDLALDLIDAEGVTNFSAPAAMTGDLVEAARRAGRPLPSLAFIGGGGAPRAPEQVRAMSSAFPAVTVGTGWGMTETNAIGTRISGRDYIARPTSTGQSAVVLDLRIADAEGRALPPHARGELRVRGVSLLRAYWNQPQATKELLDGDWLRTGDVAYMDDEGFVHIVDRIKEVIVRGGENISCVAVEAALLEYPAVAEAVVYGVPDVRLGEEVGATVFCHTPVDDAELRAFLGERLAAFQVPRYLMFAPGPLPRLASGKFIKRDVRADALRKLGLA